MDGGGSISNGSAINVTFTPAELELCDNQVFLGVVPTIDADISGIGVLVAFLVSAYLTFIVVLGAYVSGHVDPRLLRPVDTIIHRVRARPRRHHTARVLDTFIILLSDQQIVVGLAVLIAGFVGLAGSMNVYHFQIVIYLAWLASSVHLSALTMLSQFFNSHRPVMHWRLAGMSALMILLLVALVPTASKMWAIGRTDEYWEDPTVFATIPDSDRRVGWGVPAHCYFFKNHGLGVNPDAPMGIMLLLVSYIWKLGGLFAPLRRAYRRFIRRPPERLLERTLHRLATTKAHRRRIWARLCYHPLLVLYVWLFLQNELFSSFAASLHLSWIGLIFGTVQVLVPRQQNLSWNWQENQWSFGQIVPIVLLVQPVGLLLENWTKSRPSRAASSSSFDTASGRAEMRDFRNRLPLPGKDDEDVEGPLSVSECFVVLDLAAPPPAPGQLLAHQRAIFTSRIFRALVVWIELAAAGVAAFTFYWDAGTIGNSSTNNWIWIVVGVPAVLGTSILSLVVSVPFSRIFK